MTPKRIKVSSKFLTDLTVVCPSSDVVDLTPCFLEDLKMCYRHALKSSPKKSDISDSDLAGLAGQLEKWRGRQHEILKENWEKIPADDPLHSPVSLFGTMGYRRLETAHTRTLAWLLDDKEHGFGSKLLEALLLYLLRGRQIRVTKVDKVESEHAIYKGRFDIFAEGCWREEGRGEMRWVLVIEAKIDAEEGKGQLDRYDEWLKKQKYTSETKILRVFLTPRGRECKTKSSEWKSLSFSDLVGVFRGVSDLQDKPGYHFLHYYLAGVLRDICRFPVPIPEKSESCKNPYELNYYLRLVLDV